VWAIPGATTTCADRRQPNSASTSTSATATASDDGGKLNTRRILRTEKVSMQPAVARLY
jgi:hypothetical protein